MCAVVRILGLGEVGQGWRLAPSILWNLEFMGILTAGWVFQLGHEECESKKEVASALICGLLSMWVHLTEPQFSQLLSGIIIPVLPPLKVWPRSNETIFEFQKCKVLYNYCSGGRNGNSEESRLLKCRPRRCQAKTSVFPQFPLDILEELCTSLSLSLPGDNRAVNLFFLVVVISLGT